MKFRVVAAVWILGFAALVAGARIAAQPRPPVAYRDVAVDAEKWIRSSRVTTLFGYAWPSNPSDPKSISTALYSGSPGVILFLLELHHATGDLAYLDEAKKGADELLTKVPSERGMGLYEGVAGLGFTLGETWRATNDEKYRKGALDAVRVLSERAGSVGNGVQWSNTTDIIAGNAGIGLFLLYADQTLHDPTAKPLAIRAGDRLLALGIADKGGIKWAMDPAFPRLMPNFSHGTAIALRASRGSSTARSRARTICRLSRRLTGTSASFSTISRMALTSIISGGAMAPQARHDSSISWRWRRTTRPGCRGCTSPRTQS